MEAERAKRIKELQKEKDVVILAHYYVDGAVQEIADYVGDSFYLSKVATKVPQKTILFAGVTFMGESAKILNPDKTVVMADECADCPMAHMITADRIAEVREEYEDLAVVCYVNSTAEIKAVSDVCVTSSNAVKVVSNIPQKNIFFVPGPTTSADMWRRSCRRSISSSTTAFAMCTRAFMRQSCRRRRMPVRTHWC